jgi:hypothetical protein
MSEPYNAEATAWNWLLELERLDWRNYGHDKLDNQVIITACPGKLHANQGAPLVKVSVDTGERRIIGSGNSLAKAVSDLHATMFREGVQVPPPPVEVYFA